MEGIITKGFKVMFFKKKKHRCEIGKPENHPKICRL